MSSTELDALEVDAHQRLATKYLFIGFYAIFLYDFVLTIPAEVEFIWKRKFPTVTIAYFLNRYYALGVGTVICAALFSPLFTPERFKLFDPFALGIPMTIFPEIIMALRVSALYRRNRFVDVLLALYILAEFILIMILYIRPGHYPLPTPSDTQSEPFHECIDEVPASLGTAKPAAFQFMATIFDTGMFGAVVYRTIEGLRSYMKHGDRSVLGLIGAHSIVYLAVIVSSNLLWALLILVAPEGLKYSTVFATVLLVSTVINRMTLDLRAFSHTGGWFTAAPVGNVHWEVQNGQGADGEIDYEVSELTLTLTLREDVDIELDKFGVDNEGHRAKVGDS